MATGILHLHLLLALIFFIALWRGGAVWGRMAAALGILLALTGAFNFMTRMAGAPAGWPGFIGVKLLLGLHAIAVALLLLRSGVGAAKVARMKKGALISGALALLIGLYLGNFTRG
jgi:hypothetical protein